MAVPVQQEWIPWITRAIVKHFHALNRSNLFVQVPNAPDERSKYPNWLEIRIDGPRFQYSNPDQYTGIVLVDILVQTQASNNIYTTPALLGEVAEYFTCIRVLKDNDSLLGVLYLEPSIHGNDVEINDYGKIQDTNQYIGSVFGRYIIDLTT